MRRAVLLLMLLVATARAATAKTQPVEITDLVSYTFRSVFTVGVPNGWKAHDQSEGHQALVTWTDKTGNGAMWVAVNDVPSALDKAAQRKVLQDFLKKALGRNPQFQVQTTVTPTGAVGNWSYMASAGKFRARLQGRSYTMQKGHRLAVLTLAVPAEQFPSLQPWFGKVRDTLTIMGGKL